MSPRKNSWQNSAEEQLIIGLISPMVWLIQNLDCTSPDDGFLSFMKWRISRLKKCGWQRDFMTSTKLIVLYNRAL